MAQHTVRQGECLSQIARRYGFSDFRIIYNHPSNADFKRKRPNPDLIHPGDQVFIPEPEAKKVEVAAGQAHRFKLKDAKRKLHLRLRDVHGEPLRNVAYTLDLGSEVREKQTDGEGAVKEEVPLHQQTAVLAIQGVAWTLQIGDLNPVDEVGEDLTGVQARLKNLGYGSGAIDGRPSAPTQAAIRAFQEDHDLEVDGTCSSAFKDKLVEEYGC
ncbi:MAG TPA: peptidoglycan-binding protein [Myxococcaceae bacterium]|nr:peptidoglycan-binding protein [Myxococcaceae bacterium]